MNKLLTFPGQQPLYLGDIDFMQASVLEALKNLVVAITGSSAGNAVLSGIEVSYGSDTVSWTAGIVSVAGEILPVAAGSVSGNMSSTLYVKVVSTLSGGRTFKDGQSHDCWETRAATLTTEATDYRLEDFKALSSGETLYSFDGFRNIYDNYARLACCGGLWVFMLSQGAMSQSSEVFFDGYVSDVPDKVLETFRAANTVPTQIFTQLFVGSPTGGTISVIPVSVVFSSDNGKLHFTVRFASSTKTDSQGTLQVMLPRFSSLGIPTRIQ